MTGVLVLDKTAGVTSFDAVALVRKRLGLKRVGHAGTLDPEATGVLPILLGEATKLWSVLAAETHSRLILDGPSSDAAALAVVWLIIGAVAETMLPGRLECTRLSDPRQRPPAARYRASPSASAPP